MKYIIVDIDGTIADCNHRKHYISRDLKYKDRDYRKFYASCFDDAPIIPVIELVKGLVDKLGYTPIFVSGRSDECRTLTLTWLKVHLPFIKNKFNLFMRAAGDFRPDDIIKKELFENQVLNVVGDIKKIEYVLDDRNRVVEMWRGLGLTVLQVADGNF